MDSKAQKLFLAVFLGAMAGFFVGVGLDHSPYFAWVGALAGGLVGYLSYEFKKVVAAVPVAWQNARAWSARQWWEENTGRIKRTLMFSLGGTASTCTIIWHVSLPTLLFVFDPDAVMVMAWSLFIGVPFFSFILGYVVCGADASAKDAKEGRRIAIFLNPFAVWFYWVPKGLRWSIVHIPVAVRATARAVVATARGIHEAVLAIGRFVKFLFVEIHSDLRLIAGVDATLFAAMNYFSGSFGLALIVAAVGGAFGLLNRYLIAERVLGLAPRNG